MYPYNVTAIVQDRATLERGERHNGGIQRGVAPEDVPPTYDYAGVSNAVNPSREAAVLLGTFWALELISKPAWFRLRRVVGLNLLRD